MDVQLWKDSSLAKSITARRGLGKMRHVEVKYLWLQQEVLKGSITVQKIRGLENPADLLTKILRREEIEERLWGMGLTVFWV